MDNLNKACLVILMCVCFVAGCASQGQKQSAVEVREYQTRLYQDADSLTVFKSVINALQDHGFVFHSADANSGVIIASKEGTSVNSGRVLQKAALTAITYGIYWLFTDSNVNNTFTLHVTANITKVNDGIKARLNFVGHEYNVRGLLVRSGQNKNEAFYHNIFSRIDKSIFLEENI